MITGLVRKVELGSSERPIAKEDLPVLDVRFVTAVVANARKSCS